ncbi:MAG: Holliday junction branch migration protein RuvA [Coriobacteriia bacterium]|nr:Holliday junction branch migration protein RuvA [Coriobacteriia bacterium]
MIAFLRGRVVVKASTYALVEVGGVGYRLSMSSSSLAALPATGDDTLLWTHLHIREDELSLFGFSSEMEKDAFEQLITVSGVGPKVALATLSALSPDALALAVASEDIATISGVSGIGKKTAQRIILDLKDKLGAKVQGVPSAHRGRGGKGAAEATDALLAMGFSSAEIAAAVQGYDGSGSGAQALLKYALRRLGGAK